MICVTSRQAFSFDYDLSRCVVFMCCSEQSLQDQLRQAKESVVTMQKLHELAQSQLFELRAQSGAFLSLVCNKRVFDLEK